MRADGTLLGLAAAVRYCCHWTKFIGAALIDMVWSTCGLANMTDGPWRWKTLRGVLVTGGSVVVSFGNTELPSNPFVVHGVVGWFMEGVTCVDFDARTKRRKMIARADSLQKELCLESVARNPL